MNQCTRLSPQTLNPLDGPSDDGNQEMTEDGEAAGGEGQEGEPMAEAEEAHEDQALPPRVARSPREPTSAERILHEATHLPLRTWCRHCIMGRSKDSHHVTLGEARDVPRIGMDYMFVS